MPPLSIIQSSWVWAEPAHPLPNILMQFIQSNSLIKSTLMFNVLQNQRAYAEFSHCRRNWYYYSQTEFPDIPWEPRALVRVE